MLKPPVGMGAEVRTKSRKSIVSFSSTLAQHIKLRSPQPSALTSLPEHLDRYLDEPFDRQKSIELDRWLAYFAAEFEGVA